jgi:hypothetical protein
MPKRDLDRMRALMLEAESLPLHSEDESESGFVDIQSKLIDGDGYQLYLMRDQGWSEGKDVELGFFRITSNGHDYLDAIRDEGVWNKTKKTIAETGGNATLEMVKLVAIAYVRKLAKEKTGLDL